MKWEDKGESCWDGNHKKFEHRNDVIWPIFLKDHLAVVWRTDSWAGSYGNPGKRSGWTWPVFGTELHCFLSYGWDCNNFISVFYRCHILSLAFMFQRKRRPAWLFLLFSQNCPFCLEDCKTFLFILEPKFLMKQTKDMLSEVPKERVGLSKVRETQSWGQENYWKPQAWA